MGLTATFERMDGASEEILEPFFGEIVHRYGYEEAIKEKVIAPFKLAFMSVRFSIEEEEKYEKFSGEIKKAVSQLDPKPRSSRLF